jgi:uncharacterized cupredoxin-like copper-binding protein
MSLTANIGSRFGRFAAMALVAGMLTVGLAACGGEAATATPPAAPAATPTTAAATDNSGTASGGAATEIKADLKEWGIELSQTEVPAGKVKFVVANAGKFSHDLVVEDASGVVGKTSTFKADAGPQTLEVDLKPGTYKVICDITGHADKGMTTSLTVK